MGISEGVSAVNSIARNRTASERWSREKEEVERERVERAGLRSSRGRFRDGRAWKGVNVGVLVGGGAGLRRLRTSMQRGT